MGGWVGGLFIIYTFLLWGMLETRPSDERAVVSGHAAGVMVQNLAERDSARICQIWDRDVNGPGFSISTSIVSISNTSSMPIRLLYSQMLNQNACIVCVLRKLGPGVTYITMCMRGMLFF